MNAEQEKRLEIMKAAIKRDVAQHLYGLPDTISSFSELHDYVDANDYLVEAFGWEIGKEPTGFTIDKVDECNELLDAADAWIKAGGLKSGKTKS